MTELPLTAGMVQVYTGGEIRLARARMEDAAAVAQVHVAAWRAAYQTIFSPQYLAALSVPQRELLWREVISQGTPEVVVATDDDTVVGFVAFGACRDASASRTAGEVWAVYVSPSHWSVGIGRCLWRHARERLVEQDYRTVSLWVLAENARAIQFSVAAGLRRDPAGNKEFLVNGRIIKEARYTMNLRG